MANGKVEGMGSRSSRTQSQCELRERDSCRSDWGAGLQALGSLKGLY